MPKIKLSDNKIYTLGENSSSGAIYIKKTEDITYNTIFSIFTEKSLETFSLIDDSDTEFFSSSFYVPTLYCYDPVKEMFIIYIEKKEDINNKILQEKYLKLQQEKESLEAQLLNSNSEANEVLNILLGEEVANSDLN